MALQMTGGATPSCEQDFVPASSLPAMLSWDRWRPAGACYLHDAGGIHGTGHAGRVLVWSSLIANWMRQQGVAVDLDVVRWSAVLHDVRRLHDGHDPLHGARCGAWIRDGGFAASHGLRASELDARQLEQIAYCCTWHVPPDRAVPAMTPELLCLKDADALDRVRLGGLDRRFLRTGLAAALVHQAQFLCDTSELQACFRDDQWVAVRLASQRMGVWSRLDDTRRLHFFAT
ncbi:MAG: HD domain-containing protein [Oxalobacteraceae bacterium]|nr:HD domain-containing protein [Oxalobacteraceae bacterium]